MKPSRRTLLKSLAATAALLTRRLPAEPSFPDQDQIDNDPLRPRYHLMPRRGWMNDPCAPVFFQGTYHLFFQYNPGGSVWGDMHWAHAASPDMIHWQPRPIALAPTAGAPDAYGVWTGSMVINHASGKPVPTILYTATEFSTRDRATIKDATPHPIRESQCIATPTDATLNTWNKSPEPVVAAPPPGMDVTGFRDPVPFRLNDTWYMLIASGELGKGGDVLLYQSPDLHHWTYQHIFAQGKPTGKKTPDTVDSGEMWECPDFFPLGTKHVLIHSTGTPTGRATLWQSGSLDPKTMQWTPEHEGILNHGPYYAPKTQLDAHGNRILWGWIEETRPDTDLIKAGWAGCMSLPRILTLEDGQVRFGVAPEAASLRGPAHASAAPGSNQMELVAMLERATAPHPQQPKMESETLQIEFTGTGPDSITWAGKPVPLNQPLPDKLQVRAFLDHSVLEVFLGNRLVLTERVYDTGKPAILVLPSTYRVASTQAYPLKSI